MKSYNQRKNQQLIREFIGPRGQIDPMGFPNPQQQQQQNQMGMGQQPNQMMQQQPNQMGMGQQQPGMQQQPNQMGMAGQMGDMSGAMSGGQDMGDMSGAMSGGQDMGDMSGAMSGGQDMGDMAKGGQATDGQQAAAKPQMDLPTQANQFLRLLKSKPAAEIGKIQQQFNAAVQAMLAKKSKSAGKRNLWNQFTQSKDAKQNWGKDTAP